MEEPTMGHEVHIVGAGITGLGAAHMLARRGFQPVVFEASAQPGGRAGYHLRDNNCYEVGGKNFSSGHRIINGLLDEFGIHERDVQHAGFHLVMDGKLRGFDKKRTLSGDLRLATALGIRGALQFKRLLDSAMRHAEALNYESGIIETFEDRFDGRPVAEVMARRLAYGPLRMFSIIAGAAEPEEAYVSGLLHFLAGFKSGSHQSIPGGIVRLFDALARGKRVHYNTRVERILVRDGRVEGLLLRDGGGAHVIRAEQVLCTLPLPQLLQVLEVPEHVRRAAEQVRYFPLALINAEYDQDVFHDGMTSIMFDQHAHLGHCSANRLYQKHRVRFTLSGRRAREVLHLPDQDLADLAEREFGRYSPIRGTRVYCRVTRHHTGLCAYAPHFSRIRRILTDYFAGVDGLQIAGDYLDGHNMEGCLLSAERCVRALTSRQEVPSPSSLQPSQRSRYESRHETWAANAR
jgi:oxygen-dependent protoporphyrinogen oxidase